MSGSLFVPPASWEDLGLSFILMRLYSVTDLKPEMLTQRELGRAAELGETRKAKFLSARLALKALSRDLGLARSDQPGHDIETLACDGIRPELPEGPNGARYYVSVSHDKAFVLVVAGPFPLGLDMEQVHPKIVQAGRIFMHQREMALVRSFAPGADQGAVRVWGIKEAMAKLLNLPLPEAWRAVELAELGVTETRFQVEGTKLLALHVPWSDRIITIVKGC